MDLKKIKMILTDDGYSPDMINSIIQGRRRPNGDKRDEYLEKHSIPPKAWKDIKSFLNNNTNIKKSNTSRLQ